MTSSPTDQANEQQARAFTRRTVVRGVAWTVPVISMAAAAPAYATSTVCKPVIEFNEDLACKCPGQSSDANPFTYYVSFCVYDSAACPVGTGATFVIDAVTKSNSNATFVASPTACFPARVTDAQAPVPVGGCQTQVYRYLSDNSADGVSVTFTVTSGGTSTQFTTELKTPPNCDKDAKGATCPRCA